MKKKIIGIASIIAVIGILLGVYYAFRETPKNPNFGPSGDGNVGFYEKSISIQLIDELGSSYTYIFSTHADYLKQALDETPEIEYELQDGMVMVINGKRADYNLDKAYWAFYVNGDYCNYGIGDQPVNDGDEFRIEYTRV